jgi:hypothetical protein
LTVASPRHAVITTACSRRSVTLHVRAEPAASNVGSLAAAATSSDGPCAPPETPTPPEGPAQSIGWRRQRPDLTNAMSRRQRLKELHKVEAVDVDAGAKVGAGAAAAGPKGKRTEATLRTASSRWAWNSRSSGKRPAQPPMPTPLCPLGGLKVGVAAEGDAPCSCLLELPHF